ncbi:hypothetical protein EDD11_009895 [Mortierella claussenii]|nr:hypothetical protein EDD11_009895 [Mortierella claussenii]
MFRSYWLPILFVLLATTARADTVLGGLVDYLPEYNSGECYRRIGGGGCSCDVEGYSTPRQRIHDNGGGICTYVTKIDQMEKTGNVLNKTSTKYCDGPYDGSANAPVIQGFDLNNSTSHVAISLWKGVKMIRFHYLTDGQRAGWSEGVQIRFTDDFKQKLSDRDLGDKYRIYFYPDLGMSHGTHDVVVDIGCFMLTGMIPFERRVAGHQMIDCLKLQESPYGEPSDADMPEKTDSVASIYICEQGSNLQNIDTSTKSLKDTLIDCVKNLIKTGVSFVPLAGPFIAIGVDVMYDLCSDRNKYSSR